MFILRHCTISKSSDTTENTLHSTVFGEVVWSSRKIDVSYLEFLLQNKEKLNCWPDTVVFRRKIGDTWLQTTAFLVTLEIGHIPSVELLLKHNTGLGLPRGLAATRTPLQKAVEIGNMDLIQLLFGKGALVNEPAAYNGEATAFQLAAIKGYLPIIKLLLEQGADVDAPSAKINGVTALEGAAQHGRLDMVALLLSKGAAGHGKDKSQLNFAIRRAQEEGHVVVKRLLQDFVKTKELPSSTGFFPDLVNFTDCRCTAATYECGTS